jgi:pyrroloquinoline quinone (PQQ) biosynthesis protein C
VAGNAERYREFIREITLRFERAMRSLVAELQQDRAESRRSFEAVLASIAEHRDETRDLREESRAQTQALLRMLDRLDNGGTAPAA